MDRYTKCFSKYIASKFKKHLLDGKKKRQKKKRSEQTWGQTESQSLWFSPWSYLNNWEAMKKEIVKQRKVKWSYLDPGKCFEWIFGVCFYTTLVAYGTLCKKNDWAYRKPLTSVIWPSCHYEGHSRSSGCKGQPETLVPPLCYRTLKSKN